MAQAIFLTLSDKEIRNNHRVVHNTTYNPRIRTAAAHEPVAPVLLHLFVTCSPTPGRLIASFQW